jgi:hypothetical protein
MNAQYLYTKNIRIFARRYFQIMSNLKCDSCFAKMQIDFDILL